MKIVTKKYKKDSKRLLCKSKKLKKEMKNGSKPKSKITQQNKSGGGDNTSSMDSIRDDNSIFTDENIREAVNAWCDDPVAAEIKYGHISMWDTSEITNMSELFQFKRNFNDDISNWDVSNVTNMQEMFDGARAFNQPLEQWNVGNVTNMQSMFYHASAFNQPLEQWNVGNVIWFRHE